MPITALAAPEPPSCPIFDGPLPRNTGLSRPRIYDSCQCKRRAERLRLRELAKLGLAVERAIAARHN